MATEAIKKTPGKSWRVVDIVVAALIAIAGGVIFWAWSQGALAVSAPMNAVYPPLTGLIAGGWMIPAVLGMLIIRKPGAALFCETVAATGELLMGSQYGTSVLFSGFVQGLGAEIIFAVFVYRKFNLPVALLAGAAAGLFCGLNDSFSPWGWNIAYSAGDKFAYILFTSISGAIIAGALSWIATRGLARTGVLSPFASRKAATEPVFS
ncbi:ECF transporter S component [Pseudarthrobacter sp. NPDC092424]|uniref:ECF transporter S component n=1 Tax=Pseudarthrobacter sp. NPDC092424 TaxID=3364415 RepID=UPI003815B4A9